MRRRDVVLGIAAAALATQGRVLADKGDATSGALPRDLFADAEDDVVAIGRFHEFGAGAFLFDYARNRAGKLSPASAGFDLAATFDGSGDVAGRAVVRGDVMEFAAGSYKRVPIGRDAFGVASGGVLLSAEVAARTDRKPVGTILLVYGSGPGPRDGLDLWAFHFLAQGWTVVSYDKRGSGTSTGDWRLAGLETLADDAQAVIKVARERVRNGPFGVWGASQAGWIMPQLGAKGLVDFIVMHAGAATTPGQQILDQVEAELAVYGFPRAEIEKALAYYALDTDVSRGRAPWSAIEAAYSEAAAAKAEWLLGPPAPHGSPERTFIRLVADFDPAPHWQRSRAPLLALFGGKDVIVPAAKNRPLLKTLIAPGTRAEDLLLPEANHLFMVADTGVRAEYAKRTAIDAGYFPAIDRFLKTVAVQSARRSTSVRRVRFTADYRPW